MSRASTLQLLKSYRLFIVFVTWLYIAAIPGLAFDSQSIAMLCMTESAENETGYCSTNEFSWSPKIQATLFAGYSYGAVTVVLAAGALCDLLGPKWMMVASSVLALLSSVLVPISTRHGDWPAFFVLRIALGVAAASSWPVVARVASAWMLPDERGTAMGLASTGFAAGTFVANIVSGKLCCWKGWPSIFYFASIVVFVNLVLLLVFFSSRPQDSRWISRTELELILKNEEDGTRTGAKGKTKIPFVSILTSVPVLTVLICGYAERTIQFFTLIFLPTYLHDGLHVKTTTNGALSALPEVFQVIGRALSGVLADRLQFSRNQSINVKVYNTVAFLSVIGMLVGLLYIKPNQEGLVTVYMCIQFFFGSLVLAGYLRASVMIAPKFSGTIIAFSTFGAFVAAIALPYIVKVLAPDTGDQETDLIQWRDVYYVMLGIMAFATVAFLLFGTTEEQKWSKRGGAPDAARVSNEVVENGNVERF